MVDMTLNALSTEVVKVIHFGTNRFLIPITIAIMLQCCVRRSHLSSSVYIQLNIGLSLLWLNGAWATVTIESLQECG